MIRTGNEYRAGLHDVREIWIEGELVHDVTTHPAFQPVVELKARMLSSKRGSISPAGFERSPLGLVLAETWKQVH